MRGRSERERPTRRLNLPGRRAGWGTQLVLLLVGVGTAGITGAIQFSGKVRQTPGWLMVALYMVAFLLAAGSLVLRHLEKQDRERREWQISAAGMLRLAPTSAGELPRVADVSCYDLGVSRSRYAPAGEGSEDPYVSRPATDAELRRALADPQKRFVLVKGDSKAGKSRTAYEAACEVLKGARLIVPTATSDIQKLLDLDPPLDLRPKPALVWLDDLDEGQLSALTPALIDRLAPDVVILGTIESRPLSRVGSSTGQIGQAARVALGRAAQVPLDFDLSEEERADARAKYPEEVFQHSIGEPLVAAERLVTLYNAGRIENPHGHAIVRAAVDWRRAGMPRPIRDGELEKLYQEYLPQIGTGLEHDDEKWRAGLNWATTPEVSHVALIKRAGDGNQAFGHLVALADGKRGGRMRDVLPQVWDFIGQIGQPDEVFAAGYVAYGRDREEVALQMWRNADERGHALAAFNLGILLQDRGDVVGAEAAWRRADERGYAGAAVNLGILLHKRGELAEAEAAYRRADEREYGEAALNLGILLEERGDLDGAEAAYRRGEERGHVGAARDLGILLRERGDLEAAEAAFRRGEERGDAAAAVALGVLLKDGGDLKGAEAAYGRADKRGDANAAFNLGILLEKRGDLDEAEMAYRGPRSFRAETNV